MPGGRVHDRITWVTAPLVVGGAWSLGAGVRGALAVGIAYLFGGLMFSGDLDIASVQYQRWGIVRWIWLPYRAMVAHRSTWSHGPLVGTFGRLLYLALLGLGAWFVWAVISYCYTGRMLTLTLATLGEFTRPHLGVLAWGLAGLEAGAISHSLADWLGSAWRRRAGARGRSPRRAR